MKKPAGMAGDPVRRLWGWRLIRLTVRVVLLFPEALFSPLPAAGGNDLPAAFDHAGVSAGVDQGVGFVQFELVQVFDNDGVEAAGFAFPAGVARFGGAADGWHKGNNVGVGCG